MATTDINIAEIETKIIEAANNIFLKYGVDSATMGQIADETGISRTSLNYYFRSKNRLLEKVFSLLESKIIPATLFLIEDESIRMIDKIELFVDEYIDLIAKYPMVPSFIVWELSRDPNWIMQLIQQRNLNFEKLSIQIAEEVEIGTVIPFKFEDLFANIFGLCALPFVTKPVLMELFFDQNEEELSLFIASRKIEVKRILRNWLKPD